MDILQVKSDILFHDLINQDNMSIIEFIVMNILNLSYDKVHNKCMIIDSRITRTFKKDRIKYVDLIIVYQEYEIILELNNNFLGNIIRNIVYGMTRIVTYYQKYKYKNNKDYKKNYYKDKKKVILINLNWESENTINKKLVDSIEKINGLIWNRKSLLFKVINVPLDKYANMPYNEVKKRDRFYKLLTIDNNKELEIILKDEPLIEEYVKKIKELSRDKKYREVIMTEAMDRYFMEMEAYEAGEYLGMEKGIGKGIEKEKQNTIMNMYKEKMSINLISKIVNIPVNKVKEIINSKNNN